MRIKRELIGHLMEYGYLAEKTTSILIALGFVLILMIIPAWPITIINYIRNPAIFGLTSLGNSILTTVLIISTGFIAYLLPHFTPLLRPHGFKEVRDRRMRIMYVTLVSVIMSITVLAYLLFALTLIF